jgi:putative sugar O-methyltransferase
MHRDEAMNILRALARKEADVNSFSLSGLTDAIRRDWPASFKDILPAPRDLIGQRSSMLARDIHVQGLKDAIGERAARGCTTNKTKLRYHARWLLYLGAPEDEAAPKVSIIVPIYNRSWLVDALIQNCLHQTYSQTEIVVVDDGSIDDTAARLAAFGDRIKLIRQPNGGVSAARNAAVLAATGELLHFLDSDNLLHAEHLEAKVEAFASIPDADLCYCKPTEVSLFGVKQSLRQGQASSVRQDDSPTIDLLDSILAGGYPFLVSAVTMPRHVFLHYGLFDTDLRRGEDARYWFRLALGGAKAIGLARRLFYRCRMTDGLDQTKRLDETVGSIVCMRNVVDLLRRPERWPAVADYLSGNSPKRRWDRLLDNEAGLYGRDFDILLETIAGLPRAARGGTRSPLPLLIFLWLLGERSRTPQGAVRPGLNSVRELLGDPLVTAMASAEPLDQADRNDWLCRGPKLRAKQAFAEILTVKAIPKLSSEVGAKVDDATAFLRDIAGVIGDRDAVPAANAAQEKRKPRATIVVPILADLPAADATIASCLAQTVSDRLEILAIEKDKARAALWVKRYPKLRVITSPTAESAAEAHSVGLDSARSALIRFLFPGDILDSQSLAQQIECSRSFHNEVAVIELKGRSSKGLVGAVRPLSVMFESWTQPVLSAMLFPRSVLARVGGFDLSIGAAYQARYLFRLIAAGVSGSFIEAKSSLKYAKPPAGSADQIAIAALANLIQCLGNRQLWQQIPAVVQSLSAMEGNTAEDRELHSLKTRMLDFTLKVIGELSVNSNRSSLAAFALCLVGLEWGRSRTDPSLRAPQLEALRSAIFNVVPGFSLDTLGVLSLTEALNVANGDPSFFKAAKRALKAVHEGPQYVGLRDALRRLQGPRQSAREPIRSSPRRTIIKRLKWKLHKPSSITDDLEFRERLQMASTNSAAFARFRSDTLDRITELNFETGAQYAESLLRMSPSYRQLLPEFRRNDDVGDPTTYQYPQIGNFSAATLRYVKFLGDMETLFGSLNGFHIVEIGGGYGGQCRLIMSRFKPATYTMIDLPEMLRLARRYLSTFGFDQAIAFCRPVQRLPQRSADLVISNYAVSEIRRSEQERYLRNVINLARRGYILYNAARLSDRIERHTGEAPYQLADFAAHIKGATIETAWPLLVDRDRKLGNALIYWDHTTRGERLNVRDDKQ